MTCTRSIWLLPVAISILIAGARLSVAQPFFILPPVSPTDRPLEAGNSSKVVVGAFNILHVAYASNGKIYYASSSDGSTWSIPVEVSGSPAPSQPASQPAIAVTGNTLGVAWVQGADVNGYGSIRYAWRTSGTSDWIRTTITSGRQPALVAEGVSMHLAWVEPNRVRYTSFAAAEPEASPEETVASGTCSTGENFSHPSIALVPGATSCEPSRVVLAYLAQGGGTGCLYVKGTRVARRESSGTWGSLFSSLVPPSLGANPLSASLSTNRSTGHMFLAWSDKTSSGGGRTMLSRGLGTTWTPPIQVSSTARHVHVRATNSSAAPTTLFRLSWTEANSSSDPFFGSSSFDTATWDGAAPSWQGPTLLSATASGRPQSVLWRRCSFSTSPPMLTEIRAFFEALENGTTRRLATNQHIASGCSASPIPTLEACPGDALLVASIGLVGQVTPGTVLDTGSVGVIQQVSPNSATIVTASNRTIQISWRSGRAVDWSPTSLTLTAPRGDVTVSSTVRFHLLELGYLREYDRGAR